MEDDEEELWQVSSDQDTEHDSNSPEKAVMDAADTVVEGETGHSTEEKSGGVDNVCDIVEDLALLDGGHRHDILDVIVVSSRSDFDELDAQTHEGDEEKLQPYQYPAPSASVGGVHSPMREVSRHHQSQSASRGMRERPTDREPPHS